MFAKFDRCSIKAWRPSSETESVANELGPTGSFNAFQHVFPICAQDLEEIEKLDDVEPSLPDFDLGNIRLGPLQSISDLLLGHAGLGASLTDLV
jgi:hypothetical protein